MMRFMVLLASLLIVAAASADPYQLECGEAGGGGEPPLQGVVKAYLVYVSYPGDGTDSTVAVSANHSIGDAFELVDVRFKWEAEL